MFALELSFLMRPGLARSQSQVWKTLPTVSARRRATATENVYDPILVKEVWNPDFHMYKHCRTHVVHLLADGTISEAFSCGLKLT